MSAQMITQQHVDALGLLRDLVEIQKNAPELIRNHEEFRKQIAMSDEEQKKLANAHAFMASADALKEELKKAQESLKQHQQEHAKRVEDFTAEFSKKHNALQTARDELDRKAADLSIKEKKIMDDMVALENERNAIGHTRDEMLTMVKHQQELNAKSKSDNDAERERLIKLAKDVEKRLEVVKAREKALDL